MDKKMFGVVAEFSSPQSVYHAAEKVRDAGFKKWDVYSPFPIHGMDQAMGIKDTPLAWFVFFGGVFGATAGFLLQTMATTKWYKIVTSGKPLFSYWAYVPVTFEVMILFSAFAAVFGMFALNKLPQWYHAIFNYKPFVKATSHGFFIGIEAEDSLFDVQKTKSFLESIGGTNVEAVEG